MKKIVSVLLALIMGSLFIVGASATCYEGAGDIKLETGMNLAVFGHEDLGNAYWYEWEIDDEYAGYGEIEFTIYYDAFDWQGEQYCEGPEDYPAMLEYLREMYGEYYTITDCYIDGYPAIILEDYNYSETTDTSADIFICGGKYFYEVQLLGIEDGMTYDSLLNAVKNMELNGETGEPLVYDTSADEVYDEYAEDEEYAEEEYIEYEENSASDIPVKPIVRNIIIIAVISSVALMCGAVICVIVVLVVKGKKK